MNEIEISLFPIPGSVTLPYSVVPLHVFEPRYRKMITDSVTAQRRIGIAHTIKKIAESKVDPKSTLEERLSQNQSSYLAHPIFSAGFAEIKETLADGRMLVEIRTDSRYEIIKEQQEVPYKIVLCKPYLDESKPSGDQDKVPKLNATSLRSDLDSVLIKLVQNQDQNLLAYLNSKDWLDLSDEEYSFKIYSIIGFDPDVLQKVLELKTPSLRISFLNDILTRTELQ